MKTLKFPVCALLFYACAMAFQAIAQDTFDYTQESTAQQEKTNQLLANISSNRALTLTQIQYIDFGVLPSTSKRCAMKVDQTLVGDCTGSGTLGEMEVNGEPYLAYAVEVASVGWENGKQLNPKLVRQDYALDANGKDKIFVRGELRFQSDIIGTGILTMNYRITVFYQ